MISPDKLLPLIDAIYAAAADPSQWPSVARQIQCVIGGHSVNLVMEDRSDSRVSCMFSNGATKSQIENYQNNIMMNDEITAIYDQIEPGMACLTQAHFNTNALHSLFCYESFYEDLGYANFNAGLFYRDEQRRGWLSIARSETDALFSPEEFQLMQLLTPHLKRAFFINFQLVEAQFASNLALDSLEHIHAATMQLKSSAQVVQHNSQAEAYLYPTGNGSSGYTVRLPEPCANRQLKALISSIAHNRECHIDGVVPFVEKGVSKTALCFPWTGNTEQFDWLRQPACCIVFILSPTTAAAPAELLQRTFELSTAEVTVLQQLMEGNSVANIAGALFVTEATIRFHIRNLLSKTQTRNQPELIAKVFDTISIRLK